MPRPLLCLLRRLILQDHPKLSWSELEQAVSLALQGRGEYAILVAELLARQE